MGRADPLTVQALGRSPYDDVVMGTGPADPHAPAQAYDTRGRPVNPETKRINRDIIRAHNEVMQVIGVAEPEAPHSSASGSNAAASGPAGVAAAAAARLQRRYLTREANLGRMLVRVGRTVEMACVWGVTSLRNRILLFHRYAGVPFYDLVAAEREVRTTVSMFFGGLPGLCITDAVVLGVQFILPWLHKRTWFRCLNLYLQMHALFYATLQRLDLVPYSQILPSPLFYVPFTAQSAIPPLPPFGSSSIFRWLAASAVTLAPSAVFLATRLGWSKLGIYICRTVYRRLPIVNTRKSRGARPTSTAGLDDPGSGPAPARATTPSPSRSSTEHSSPSPEGPPSPPAEPPQALAQARAQAQAHENPHAYVPTRMPPVPPHGDPPSEAPPEYAAPNRPRRTSSAITYGPPPALPGHHQGRDQLEENALATDDEDDESTDGPSAPVISFDIEATEVVDSAPTGPWSAELRPTLGANGRRAARASKPAYRDTVLTRTPAIFASHVLAAAATTMLMLPFEAVAVRMVARQWCARRGLTTLGASMYGVWDIAGLATWRSVTNLVGVAFIRLIVDMEIWATVSMFSEHMHMTEAQWKERKAREAEGRVLEEEEERGRQAR